MTLEVKAEAKKLREMYKEDPKQQGFNLLLLGETGSGKTRILTTCPFPAHIDSFDPGGTRIRELRKEIDRGNIIADVRYEGEDPEKPSVFVEWNDIFKQRLRSGYFNSIGTYMLDSSTFWAEAIMNSILKKVSLAGKPPRWAHDHEPQKYIIRNHLNVMLNLPCNVIITGHLEGTEDKVTGGKSYRYMIVGKGTVLFPLKFDETYVMDPRDTATGVEYRLLTQSTGRYVAATRIGSGVFDKYEKPDIKMLLKKAGLPYQNKPPLFEKGDLT